MTRFMAFVAALLFALAWGPGDNTASADPDLLQDIIDRGEIRIFSYNFPPEGGLNPQTGEPEGFDVDVWKAIAEELGVRAKFKFFTEATLGSALNGGQADGAMGHQYTAERAKVISYSKPYWCVTQVVAAKKGSGIKKFEDLKGKTVGSVRGTAEALTLRNLGGEFELTERSYDMSDPMFKDLSLGRLDAMVWDDFIIRWAMKILPDFAEEVEIVAPIPSKYTGATGEVHLLFPKKNSDALRDRVNELIARFQSDGTLDRFFEKWGLNPDAMHC